MVEVINALTKLYNDYQKSTPSKLKIIDAYLLYIMITGITQFVYCVLVGTFPFNAFLAGFCSTVASFVLAGWFYFQTKSQFLKVLRLTWRKSFEFY